MRCIHINIFYGFNYYNEQVAVYKEALRDDYGKQTDLILAHPLPLYLHAGALDWSVPSFPLQWQDRCAEVVVQ